MALWLVGGLATKGPKKKWACTSAPAPLQQPTASMALCTTSSLALHSLACASVSSRELPTMVLTYSITSLKSSVENCVYGAGGGEGMGDGWLAGPMWMLQGDADTRAGSGKEQSRRSEGRAERGEGRKETSLAAIAMRTMYGLYMNCRMYCDAPCGDWG